MKISKSLVQEGYATTIFRNDEEVITIGDIISLLRRRGIRCFITGGAVREWVMDAIPSDIDISVPAPIDEVIDVIMNEYPHENFLLFREGNFGIAVFGDPELYHLDINIFRRPEDYQTKKFTAGSCLIQDSLTKDFTINSLYFDCETEEVIDPSKRGFSDVRNNCLHIHGCQEVMTSNPRLCLRIIKFLMKGWEPSNATKSFLTERLENDLLSMEVAIFHTFLRYQIVDKRLCIEEFRKTLHDQVISQAAKELVDELCESY